LVHIILEQQVSLASARAAFDRLKEATRPITPKGFLMLGDEELKRIGFSRQKAAYCRGLASAIQSRELRLKALGEAEDDAARSALLAVRGIGPWTADIYLLMVLLRPDVWPTGDMALAVAYQERYRLRERPSQERLGRIAERWRPWRAVAARLLWHDYLSARIRSTDSSSSAVKSSR
ncbi:MAG TPA: DNA-3-methyladenine glycosylase 2 family protein, partial [Spirochaetia bacterium]|nr:DNA-3-methyladenine glycosylase 2 family protein [Spirochaetia bacterium]